MKIKRYLVFVWPAYDAYGGWGDLLSHYDTLEEATNGLKEERIKYGESYHGWCVVDLESEEQGCIVEEGMT